MVMMARRPAALSALALALALAAVLNGAQACIELYGHNYESTSNATHWDYGFLGGDWKGVDATGKPWVCLSGKFQSPIDIPDDLPNMPDCAKTKFITSKVTSKTKPIALMWNNGHTIQAQDFLTNPSTIKVATMGDSVTDIVTKKIRTYDIQYITLKAVNFHFHSVSEHAWHGMQTQLEMHVVHKSEAGVLPGCPNGCFAVVGIMLRAREGADNAYLAPFLKAAPKKEGTTAPVPAGATLDLGKIYPKDKTYATYKGSLTVPPCTEGLLWHVFAQPVYISMRQYKQYLELTGSKSCNSTDHASHADAEHAPASGECKLAGYGSTFRLTQPILGRKVYWAA